MAQTAEDRFTPIEEASPLAVPVAEWHNRKSYLWLPGPGWEVDRLAVELLAHLEECGPVRRQSAK